MTSAAGSGRLPILRITIQDIVAAAAVTAIAATLSLRSADVSLPQLFARSDRVPNVVPAAPAFAPRYLDRAALAAQSVAPPQLVRDILWPAFGSPAIAALGGFGYHGPISGW